MRRPANADFKGLPDVNQGICTTEKTLSAAPPNCAMLPECPPTKGSFSMPYRDERYRRRARKRNRIVTIVVLALLVEIIVMIVLLSHGCSSRRGTPDITSQQTAPTATETPVPADTPLQPRSPRRFPRLPCGAMRWMAIFPFIRSLKWMRRSLPSQWTTLASPKI